MKINWMNAIIGTMIVGLLAWLLWEMGIDSTQKWLLASLGGAIMEVGVIGGTGINYDNARSGIQVRIISLLTTAVSFSLSAIYSFFDFSVQAYCIPLGIIFLIFLMIAIKIFNTRE